MCGGPEHPKPTSSQSSPSPSSSNFFEGNGSASPPPAKDTMMNHLTLETEDDSSSILELAANNDLDGFKRLIDQDPSAIDEIGLWYGRKKGCSQMVLEPRTTLMVASTYGSVDVLKLILSRSAANVNRCCRPDKSTALHCAASGGSVKAVDAVKVLLFAGADPNSVDANGHLPSDVIVVSPKLPDGRVALEELLGTTRMPSVIGDQHHNIRVSTSMMNSNSLPLSSPNDDGSPSSDSTSSPITGRFHDLPPSMLVSEKKEYLVDPSLPDIKNSIYATDEFRMFSFKVRPCSRAYSHDWTECPFVHPGENARRRDPRKYLYSCVPCSDFRKGACRRGDLCEYAHGVFECWLHPAQYRTRLCKDGTSCMRRVCFFAHAAEELRPLYGSTSSTMPSPRSSASASMEMAAAMSLLPGSPSPSVMSPPAFTLPMPMSPSGNGISHSSLAWPQPNVPTLHLPGGNLQSSRLRSAISARGIPVDDFPVCLEYDAQQLLYDFSCLSSNQARLCSLVGSCPSRSKTVTPSNLEDLFSAEISSSPRYKFDQAASPRYNFDQVAATFAHSHSSVVPNQFQQQQSLLSPINTNVFSPKTVDPQQLPGHNSFLQASFGISSPGMSPRSVEPISPMSGRLGAFAQREKQQQQLGSLSLRELDSGMSTINVVSPMDSPQSKWGFPSGKVDWGVSGEELGCRFKQPLTYELGSVDDEEPDLSWVQSLVKESPPEMKDKLVATATSSAPSANGDNSNSNS